MASIPKQDEENLGPLILTISWTLAAIAIIIVILRVLTRFKSKHGVRIDDYFMLLSLVRQRRFLPDLTTALIIWQGMWGGQHDSH